MAQLLLELLSGTFFTTWTLYLQRGLGLTPLQAAGTFVLIALGELAGGVIVMQTVGRLGRRVPQTGPVIAVAAMVVHGVQVSTRQACSTPRPSSASPSAPR
ncbi:MULTISPECIES: hypothetical protein [Streptomyces]|uniref:hypothetical protein n=1 Tax=Streptomyces TaxID=1883 RepID=UPI001E557E78|nr:MULTISPECIES: hypothetical protein [Streptomyces]UFQ18994.1 hypothetical protein J2N69_30685 [Streptomyces huasconensis]WCL88613.1 hypothetical protein PPN52_30650 [Streptomyces sp. JCM 35825]